MGPRKNNLRALGSHADIRDVSTNTVALAIILTRNLLTMRQQGLGTAKVNNQVTTLVTTHDTVDQLAETILEFIEDAFTLGFPNLLNNHLLGSLCSNTTEAAGIHLHTEGVTNFYIRVNFLRLTKINFLVRVFHFFNNSDKLEDFDFTDFIVKVSLEIAGIAIFLVRCRKHSSLKSLNQHSAVDPFVFDHLVDNVIQVDIHPFPLHTPLFHGDGCC